MCKCKWIGRRELSIPDIFPQTIFIKFIQASIHQFVFSKFPYPFTFFAFNLNKFKSTFLSVSIPILRIIYRPKYWDIIFIFINFWRWFPSSELIFFSSSFPSYLPKMRHRPQMRQPMSFWPMFRQGICRQKPGLPHANMPLVFSFSKDVFKFIMPPFQLGRKPKRKLVLFFNSNSTIPKFSNRTL